MKKVRVRIAPSPTGYPHIGTIYQALFNWAYAKKNSGVFYVRIEDTDRNRFVQGAEDVIFQSLDWFGLVEAESSRKGGPFAPYRQSERLPVYLEHAKQLITIGGAYYCFCSKERLDEVRKKQQEEKIPTMYDRHCRNLSQEEVLTKLEKGEPWVIRLKVPDTKEYVVTDGVRGKITFDLSLIEDAILMKSDGYPTYHLAAMVDDHLMQTTHVVRAEEWLPSLPKHMLIFDYFGWEPPLFFHTPSLRNPDKSKLSKRHGHTNVKWYQEEGYLPEAILNYIAMLGWTHPEGREIFSLDEFMQLFDLKDIRAVAPVFDVTKLTWMNGEYLRSLELRVISDKLREFYKADTEVLHILDSADAHAIISLAQSRMKTLKEFRDLIIPTKAVLQDEEKEVGKVLLEKLTSLTEWNRDTILVVIREVIKQKKVKGSLLYTIVTGRPSGLPLPESLELLGKEKTLARVHEAVT